jgi:hypothetical protein
MNGRLSHHLPRADAEQERSENGDNNNSGQFSIPFAFMLLRILRQKLFHGTFHFNGHYFPTGGLSPDVFGNLLVTR